MTYQNKSPNIVGATEGKRNDKAKFYYTLDDKKRIFDRALLPKPAGYYSRQFPKSSLRFKSGWATVICCFHSDHNPSLRINQVEGHFRCFSCNAKGRDILAFHQLRYQLGFIDAVTALGAWRYE